MRGGNRTAAALTAALAAALVASAPVWAQTIKREKAIPISSVEGKDTYKEFCVSCHGEDGKGGGRAAAALKTPPPDLTKLAARSGGKFNQAAVEFAIKGDPERPHSSSDMPEWRRIFRTFSADDNVTTLRLRNLVAYLESIQAK